MQMRAACPARSIIRRPDTLKGARRSLTSRNRFSPLSR
jgi:hypothetical protein